MMLPASTFTLLPVSHRDKRKVSPRPRRESTNLMGLISLAATVMNPADAKKRLKIEFLVDSGALYSVVPKAALKRLGIKPCGSKEFTFADGTKIIRKFGNALFSIQETPGASPVIFGERGTAHYLAWFRLKRWVTSSIRCEENSARCRWCWGRKGDWRLFCRLGQACLYE